MLKTPCLHVFLPRAELYLKCIYYTDTFLNESIKCVYKKKTVGHRIRRIELVIVDVPQSIDAFSVSLSSVNRQSVSSLLFPH